MSFDAFCWCENCNKGFYECAEEDKTYPCPLCSRMVEPEELDLY